MAGCQLEHATALAAICSLLQPSREEALSLHRGASRHFFYSSTQLLNLAL